MSLKSLDGPCVDASTEGFRAAELEAFRRCGFAVVRRLADPAMCEEMLARAEEDLRREVPPIEYEADVGYPGAPASRDAEGGRTVRRLKQAHARGFVFTRWLSDPRLGRYLRQLLGDEVFVPLAHHNCIMTKQPRYSSETGWHQDIRYWSFERPELVSVWLALGTETDENGCLWLIPGTHAMSFERHRLDEALFLRPDLPENRELIERRVAAPLEAGDVLFFHCRTFHGAGRNTTSATKYSVVFTARPADNRPIPGTRSASLPELKLP